MSRAVATVAAAAPVASPARAPVARLEYIDGLRALAALWVVLHHVLETAWPTRALSLAGVGPVLASLAFGQFPVMIFLMLSGFCLYYPYVRKNPERPYFYTGFRAYITRRATRIAPPYLWCGAFCIAMSAVPELQVGRWKQSVPIDAGVIATHLLFIHNLIPAHSIKIDYPMWSIGLEWQLYLTFPIFVWALRRAQAPLVVGVALAVAAVVHATYHHVPPWLGSVLREGPLAYLEIFSLGMVAAALTVRKRMIAPRWVLGCIAVGGLLAVRFGQGNGLAHDLETSAAAFAILLLAADPRSLAARILSTKWLVAIGVFSYSLYLVHAPLLHLCWFGLRPFHLSGDTMFLVLVIGCLPVIVALSYGFHCLFERPFMRVRAREVAPVGVSAAE
jgi:peptidoglycan/LPS O-acetylase OafA/YrhL